MLLSWYFMTDWAPSWLYVLAFVLVIGTWWIGISLQIFYYVKLHHKNFDKEVIKVYVPCSELACIARRPNEDVIDKIRQQMEPYVIRWTLDEHEEALEDIVHKLSPLRGEVLHSKINKCVQYYFEHDCVFEKKIADK